MYFLTFCLFCVLQSNLMKAQFAIESEVQRDPLQALDVPFVPEDFRSSPKRIIFDKNDFVSLPKEDLEPLHEAIVKVLQETQARANNSKVCTFKDLEHLTDI